MEFSHPPLIGRPLIGRHSAAALTIALLLTASEAPIFLGEAHAQPNDQRRIERQLRIADSALLRYAPDPNLSLEERSLLEFGGNLSFTALFLRDATENSRRLLQPEAVVYARGSIDGAHNAFGRVRLTYRDYSEGDSFDGRPDRIDEPVLDRYWYEFDARRAMQAGGSTAAQGANFNIRTGRQFVDWGAGLALSSTLYAVRPTIDFSRSVRIEGLAGITPDHTIDFDASRVDYDEKTRRTYFGARLVVSDRSNNEYYAYYLYSGDNYNRTVSRAPIIFTDVIFDSPSHFVGLGTTLSLSDNLSLLGEVVGQFGTTFSDPIRGPQVRDEVVAAAMRVQASYIFRDNIKSRLEFEFLAGTGDGDRLSPTDTVGGNAPGTTDRAFNSLGFANTGLAFGAPLNNLTSTRIGYNCEPFGDIGQTSNLQVGIDGFLFGKFRTQAPIDEPTNLRTFLGGEIDLFINYRITSDLAVSARYGIFLPGEAVAGSEAARDFALFSVVLSF